MPLPTAWLVRRGTSEKVTPVLRTVAILKQCRNEGGGQMEEQKGEESKEKEEEEGEKEGEQQQQQQQQQQEEKQERQVLPKIELVDVPAVHFSGQHPCHSGGVRAHHGARRTPPGLTANAARSAYPLVGLVLQRSGSNRAVCEFYRVACSEIGGYWSCPLGYATRFQWVTKSLYIDDHYVRDLLCAMVGYTEASVGFENRLFAPLPPLSPPSSWSLPFELHPAYVPPSSPSSRLLPPPAPAPAPASHPPRSPPPPPAAAAAAASQTNASLSTRDRQKWVADEFARRGLNKIAHCRSFEDQRQMHKDIIATASPLERKALQAALSFHRAVLHRLPGEAPVW